MKSYIQHKSTRYLNNDTESISFKKSEKTLPAIYDKRENCCGCTACYAVCPKQAISMLPDEQGFLYPVVDAALCVRCYKCLSVCAFKEAQKERGYF